MLNSHGPMLVPHHLKLHRIGTECKWWRNNRQVSRLRVGRGGEPSLHTACQSVQKASPPVSPNALPIIARSSGAWFRFRLVASALNSRGCFTVDLTVRWLNSHTLELFHCVLWCCNGSVGNGKERYFPPTDFLKLTGWFPVTTKHFRHGCFQNKSTPSWQFRF